MFQIGERVVCINKKRWQQKVNKQLLSFGPEYLEINTISKICEGGFLAFSEYGHKYVFYPYSFEKLVSDQELNEYRDKVSQVELDHFNIEKIEII